MKLKTSFFNPTVFRKNMTRFFPVWGLATIFLGIAMLSALTDGTNSEAMFFMETCSPMSVANCIYALVCAMILLGTLYNPRLCNALHAMPLRRECWFFTHVASGIVFALIPYVLTAVAALVLLEKYTFVALLWFLAVMGQFLFHFSLAMLCGVCVGNQFAHAVLYSIACFLSVILSSVLTTFYEPLLYGVQFNQDIPLLFCPTIQMSEYYTNWTHNGRYWVFLSVDTAAWVNLAVFVLIGIGLLFAALAVYKRRKLEGAGDFLTVNALRPVFLLLYILLAGMGFYWIGDVFIVGEGYILAFLGMAVGYFTGKMLLNRTVKVFHLKSVLTAGAILLAIGATMVVTWLDPLGIVTWIPKEPVSVTLQTNHNYSNPSLKLTEPEDIALVQRIHRKMVTERSEEEVTVYLTYTLPSGLMIQREYRTDVETLQPVKKHLSSWEYVMNGNTYESLLDGVRLVEVSKAEQTSMEILQPLLDAIRKDCKEGNMVQDWSFHEGQTIAWINFWYYTENGDSIWVNVEIYDEAVHTKKVLETYVPQVLEEEQFLE